MNKVYIICEPTHVKNGVKISSVDLSPASVWGEPIVLLPDMQTLLSPKSTIAVLHEKLASFNDADYLVPIGDPILMSIVASIACIYNKGRVKYLKWDKRNSGYTPIQTDLFTATERA